MARPIVHLCNTPSPYRNAEWDTAAAELGRDSVAVIFADTHYRTACWQPDFPKLCPYFTIGGTSEQHGISVRDVPQVLSRLNPRAVILSGYRRGPYRLARRWCRRHQIPFCLRSDGNIYRLTARKERSFKSVLRRYWLSRCVRQADQCLITGTRNREYWRYFGMRPGQEGWFPQWIDYPLFTSARDLRKNQREELRRAFGIRPRYTVFTAGRILALKRIDLLCEALLRLDDRLGLVVAGHGPEEESLRRRYQHRLGERLMFVGNVEPRDLPKWYAATDLYALASGSHEAWGLVLDEAAAAGMPIIAHQLVGAAGDLVEDGVNGFTLDTTEPEVWASTMQRFLDEPALLDRMGAESCRISDAWQAGCEPGRCVGRLLETYRI